MEASLGMGPGMGLSLTTPGLLFPAISLLLLAYTNRFVALANIIRQLHAASEGKLTPRTQAEIGNLRRRLYMIRHMQEAGVVALLLCVLCMALLFFDQILFGEIVFAFSLLLFAVSLVLSVAEIHISVRALDIHLSDVEETQTPRYLETPKAPGRKDHDSARTHQPSTDPAP